MTLFSTEDVICLLTQLLIDTIPEDETSMNGWKTLYSLSTQQTLLQHKRVTHNSVRLGEAFIRSTIFPGYTLSQAKKEHPSIFSRRQWPRSISLCVRLFFGF